MAKALQFVLQSREFPLEPIRLDRKKLYGWTEKVALDEKGDSCSLVSIDETGSFVIPKGGIGQGEVNNIGEWVDKGALVAVNERGDPAEKLPSSFDEPIVLDQTVSIEEFLDHYITSIYTLQGEENCPDFVKSIASGPIYTFPFSFRGGYTCDPAFIVESKGELFVLVGKKADFEFVGLEQTGFLEAESSDDDETDDDLDFSMM
jgi:hypothetical protein